MKIYHILIISIFLRLIPAITTIIPPLEPDSGHYNQIATGILSGKGFGDVLTRPPVYPVFLSGIYAIFGEGNFTAVKVIQAILSTITVYIVFILTKELLTNHIWTSSLRSLERTTIQGAEASSVALLASIICSVDPFQIYFCGKILTETIFILLLVLFIYLFERSISNKGYLRHLPAPVTEKRGLQRSWIYWIFPCGIVLGIANLSRAVALGIFFFYIISGIVAGKIRLPKGGYKDIIKISVIFIVALLVMLPWILRNYSVFGKFIPVSVQKGWNMYEGLNPNFDNPEAIKSWQDKMGEEIAGMNIIDGDNYFWKKSINWIKSHPKEFIVLSIRKFFKFWRLYPYGFAYSLKIQIVSVAFFVPLLLFAIYGIILSIKEWQKFWILYSTIIYFSILGMLFACQIRYRIPVHSILAIFA
ncbi:MAG: hypothetical protein QME68_08155, partial [Elusimicrobiota bacterium]|nr:hypothetical protein [Elusimicrobiota bacterium]